MNDFVKCVEESPAILMEGALGERLKREYGLIPDANVALASMIYSPQGRSALRTIWKEYMETARKYRLPFLAATPTRRANNERVLHAGLDSRIISDNVSFLKEVAGSSKIEMYVGGLMGCKGDAYTGAGALSEQDSEQFHQWQANLFKDAKADYLFAGIMPAVPEAAGMAKAMANTGLPYIISFTIQENGRLIDGTTISDAISYIDNSVSSSPVCYMTNCVHPSIVYKSLSHPLNQNPVVSKRFWGIQANTSPLPYDQLDQSEDLHFSDPELLAEQMMELRGISSIKIWGGCCGTDNRHMEAIAKRLL